jgi:hypothetical protein
MGDARRVYCTFCEQTYFTEDVETCALCRKAGGLMDPEAPAALRDLVSKKGPPSQSAEQPRQGPVPKPTVDPTEFLAAVEDCLRGLKQSVSRDVELPEGPLAHLVGSRTYFCWNGFIIISQHLVLRRVETASRADAERLFAAGFRYAKRVNRVPLLRGMQFAYTVLPCLVVDGAEEDLIRYVEGTPRKHWALSEFPVVVDLSTRNVHYHQGTPLWGAIFFSDMRHLAQFGIVEALARTAPGAENQPVPGHSGIRNSSHVTTRTSDKLTATPGATLPADGGGPSE